ncbi:MAG: hypothetical protein C5B60_12340 [Chloroflexi bacterium]|nr:MAG: hypothetical protein C5B60_12340 [Chloroflexota bacterium]
MEIRKGSPQKPVKRKLMPVTPVTPRQRNISVCSPLPPSVLEPPVRTRLSVRQRLGELRAAIAEGFLIQEPIYARPLWSSPDNSRIAYSFVLQLNQVTRLITVPDGRTIQQFIRKRDLTVDYRR